MKEKIVFAPGAGNSELLRMLARFGKNTLGLRVMSRVDLAKFALMKAGKPVTEEFLPSKEEPSVIFSFLREVDYFNTSSFADAENLASAIMTARALIPENEEAVLSSEFVKGEFPEKNKAIAEVYEKFLGKCGGDGRIDSISLVRRAITEAGPVNDAEFFTLKEYPLMPIDSKLLEIASGGACKETTLTELLGREKKGLSGITFTEGYGRINEVEDILSGIFEKDIPLDKCTIASADTAAYSQAIYDLSVRYDIPVTYGCGVPIMNSNPGRLLKLIFEWKTSGYYGVDSLRKILVSDAFELDRFAKVIKAKEGLKKSDIEELAKMAGNLRLSFNDEENRKKLEALGNVIDEDCTRLSKSGSEKDNKRSEILLKTYLRTVNLANQLAFGMVTFLSRFARVREDEQGRIDQAALRVIDEAISGYLRYASPGEPDEMIPEILRKSVCSEASREGAVHFTSIEGALSSLRENLYVCGLSAAEFPGSPAENYLTLDSDLLLLDSEAPTSENKIKRKIDSFETLIGTAASLDIPVNLSFAGYDLSELKEQNPSSVLFSIYEEMNGDTDMEAFRKDLRYAPYFGDSLTFDRLVGKAYSEGYNIGYKAQSEKKPGSGSALEKVWAPTALSDFMACPRRFYLERLIGAGEEEPDDPFMILSAAETGTITHSMMEKLAWEKLSKEEFLSVAGEAFDTAMLKRPPMHEADAKDTRAEFLRMMETAFDNEPGNRVVSAEKEYSTVHPSGVGIHGFPDRVEQAADGKYIVADYKSKRRIEHVKDDFASCMQVVIYAWLCEQAGIDVSSCEYRYIRQGKTVTCRYDGEMKEKLDEFLKGFGAALQTGVFPRTPGKNNEACTYCKVKAICEWNDDEEAADE